MSPMKTTVIMLIAFALHGCLGKDPASPAGKAPGSLSLKIQVSAASPFKTIARTGDITVSATDMNPIVAALVIKDSTVEGKVVGIPSGRGRSIVVKVYDSAGTVRYQGSTTADINADAEASVSVTLVRKTGSVVVGGTVSETDTTLSTPWGATVRLSVGAQASPTIGAVMELDDPRSWTASVAHANQENIDLVLMYYGGAFHLDNAVAAKAAGIENSINLTIPYDAARIKDIRIVKIAANPSDQEKARAAFADGVKIKGSAVAAGDRLLVETTGGKLVLVTVVSTTGDRAGNIEADVNPVTIP